jgi:hypothetical protein
VGVGRAGVAIACWVAPPCADTPTTRAGGASDPARTSVGSTRCVAGRGSPGGAAGALRTRATPPADCTDRGAIRAPAAPMPHALSFTPGRCRCRRNSRCMTGRTCHRCRHRPSHSPPLAQADPTAPAGRSTMVATTPSLVRRIHPGTITTSPCLDPCTQYKCRSGAPIRQGPNLKRTARREGNRLTRSLRGLCSWVPSTSRS